MRQYSLKAISAFTLIAVGLGLFLMSPYGPFNLSGGNDGSAIAAETLEIPKSKYPIIYQGETYELAEDINSIETFLPLFDGERETVNPSDPKVIESTKLLFDVPGEYYLQINQSSNLKILVLSFEDSLSENIVSLFDFITANFLPMRGQGESFYQNRNNYIDSFFQDGDPGLLLCGPTHSLLERLLADRFNIPVRNVTFTGTFLQSGKVQYTTHNMLEVYLPDIEQWILFDVNNGFYVEWKSAVEISQIVRDTAGSGRKLSSEEWGAIDWAAYDAKVANSVLPYRAADANNADAEYKPEHVSDIRADSVWHTTSQYFVGGPSYWNIKRHGAPGLPEDFDLYYVTMHDDELLIEASKRWQTNWNLTVKVVTKGEIKEMHSNVYSELIAEKGWLDYIHPIQRIKLVSGN
jgi:hypothetical protein